MRLKNFFKIKRMILMMMIWTHLKSNKICNFVENKIKCKSFELTTLKIFQFILISFFYYFTVSKIFYFL